MALDERGNRVLVFLGNGPNVPHSVIEVGDEATLYHDGNILRVLITGISGHKITGIIAQSAYDPDLHQEYIAGNEITFEEKNIFRILKRR